MKINQNALLGLVIVLVIVNLILMVIVWKGHRQMTIARAAPHLSAHRMDRQMDVLHRQLDLSRQQMDLFREAFKEHHDQNREALQQDQALRKQLHEAVFAGDQTMVDSLKQESIRLHQGLTDNYVAFTQRLAESCAPEQREAMLRLLDRVPGPQPDAPKRERRKRQNEGH